MFLNRVLRVGAVALLCSATPFVAQAQSLTEALAYAYSNNPSIASSFLDVRAAREGIRAAEGGRLPTVGASANIGHSWSSGVGGGPSDSIGLNYSQTLFDNNKTSASILAAEASYEAAIQGARNVEQNTLLSVASAYLSVVSTSRLVEIRQENIGFVRAQVQSARDRLEIGEGTRLDVAQAEASLAQAEAAHLAAVNNLRTAEANFERWVGRAPRGLSNTFNFRNLLPGSVDAALASATLQHPALLASSARLRAAQHRADEVRAGFGPNVSFTGSAGAGGFTSGTGVDTNASVSLRLSVPIFTPSRDPSLEQANIGQIQTELEGFATRDQIVAAVREAWSGQQSATAQIQAATAAVAASRLALEAVIAQNEVGQATTLDVLNARASLLTVEESLVSAQSQRMVASFSLLAAMGNLSAQSLALPVQLRSPEGTVAVQPVAVPTDAWGNLR